MVVVVGELCGGGLWCSLRMRSVAMIEEGLGWLVGKKAKNG